MKVTTVEKGTALICLVAACSMVVPIFSTNFYFVLASFLVVEACVGASFGELRFYTRTRAFYLSRFSSRALSLSRSSAFFRARLFSISFSLADLLDQLLLFPGVIFGCRGLCWGILWCGVFLQTHDRSFAFSRARALSRSPTRYVYFSFSPILPTNFYLILASFSIIKACAVGHSLVCCLLSHAQIERERERERESERGKSANLCVSTCCDTQTRSLSWFLSRALSLALSRVLSLLHMRAPSRAGPLSLSLSLSPMVSSKFYFVLASFSVVEAHVGACFGVWHI